MIGPTTEVLLFSTASGGGARGFSFVGVALPVYLPENQPFLRRICSGEVTICHQLRTVPIVLCDITEGGSQGFIRQYTYAGGKLFNVQSKVLDGGRHGRRASF